MKNYEGMCPELQRSDTWGIHPEYQEMEQSAQERVRFLDWFNSEEVQGDFDVAKRKMK